MAQSPTASYSAGFPFTSPGTPPNTPQVSLLTSPKKTNEELFQEKLKKALWRGASGMLTVYLIELPLTHIQAFLFGSFCSFLGDRLNILPDDLAVYEVRQSLHFRTLLIAFKALISLVVGWQLLLTMDVTMAFYRVVVLFVYHQFLDWGARGALNRALQVIQERWQTLFPASK